MGTTQAINVYKVGTPWETGCQCVCEVPPELGQQLLIDGMIVMQKSPLDRKKEQRWLAGMNGVAYKKVRPALDFKYNVSIELPYMDIYLLGAGA